jgi:DNA-directed RNA polymerase specialized sigma24 family protein
MADPIEECARRCRSFWRRYGRGLPRDLEADCWSAAALHLHESRERLRSKPIGEQLPYACGIVRHAFLAVTGRERRWRRRTTSIDMHEHGGAVDGFVGRDMAPRRGVLAERIDNAEVAAAFSALPDRTQKLLELWLVEGLSDQDIARRIGEGGAPAPSADAVKMQRHRAVRRLRARLAPELSRAKKLEAGVTS